MKENKMNIEKYDTVSFDIFDTLVSRRIYRPADLFSLMQIEIANNSNILLSGHEEIIDNFAEMRVQAEVSARAKRVNKFGGEPEVTIFEIYDEIKELNVGISKEIINQLIQLEISTEKAVLYKNNSGYKLFQAAVENGSKIIIISDMYFPTSILKELLISCGYNVDNIPIYSSGEMRASKNSGELYTLIKEREKPRQNSWLHVGDNPRSDISNAKKHGIHTIQADWSEYEHGTSFHWRAKDVVGESLYKALSLKQTSSFYTKDPLTEIGFKVFGPLLLGYISWMSNQLKVHKIDKALFLARDAHLIYKIYNKYFSDDQIESEYVYISRASSYMIGMTDWPMHRIWHLFGGKNKKSLKKILSIAGLDAKKYISDIHNVGFPNEEYIPKQGDEHKVHWLINKLFSNILLKNTQNRNEYSGYFKKACGEHKNIALIDVGWMGNIQSVFARSLSDGWATKNIHGFYLATFHGANDNRSIYNKMFGWLANYGIPQEKCDLFFAGGIELMEFAMADNTGSTIGYKKTADGIIPVREKNSDSEVSYLNKAQRLQSGIIAFFEYLHPLLNKENIDELNSTTLSEPFFQLVSNPTTYQIEALSSLTHSESVGGNSERIMLAKKLPLKERLFPGKIYASELETSYWKEGFKRLNRKKFWAEYN